MNAAPAVAAYSHTRVEADDHVITRAGMWRADHLHRKTGVDVASGLTDPYLRADRIRKLILERGLADQRIGNASGKVETYRQFVKRALGIELEPGPQASLL